MTLTRWTKPMPKPSRTARKKATLKDRREKVTKEETEKRKVRKRDKYRCRFPLCGCDKLKLPLEVSHDKHKGMGSKDGVSIASIMVLLCTHRHQHGRISRHAGTLRARYLTSDGYNGPVVWEIDIDPILRDGRLDGWIRGSLQRAANASTEFLEVARESAPGVLEPLSVTQRLALSILSEMEL